MNSVKCETCRLSVRCPYHSWTEDNNDCVMWRAKIQGETWPPPEYVKPKRVRKKYVPILALTEATNG